MHRQIYTEPIEIYTRWISRVRDEIFQRTTPLRARTLVTCTFAYFSTSGACKIGKEMDGNLYLDVDFLEKKAAILKLYCTFLMNTRGCSILCNHFHNVWWSHRGYIYKSFVYYLFPNAIEYIGIILFKNMLFVYINHCWNFYFLGKWNFSKEICLFKILKYTIGPADKYITQMFLRACFTFFWEEWIFLFIHTSFVGAHIFSRWLEKLQLNAKFERSLLNL